MKKLLTILAILGTGTPILAQNWNPLTYFNYYNYKYDDSPNISNIILIENSRVEDNTVIFTLNKIGKYCPECSTNQDIFKKIPQFLLEEMVILPNNVIQLRHDTIWYELHTGATLNESWNFSATQTATVTRYDTLSLFTESIIDSVKTIQLSNGDSILLTKTYGILYFPDFNGSGYRLVGINGKGIGEQYPSDNYYTTLKEGDYFSVYTSTLDASAGFMCINSTYEIHRIKKRTISTNTISFLCDSKITSSGYPLCEKSAYYSHTELILDNSVHYTSITARFLYPQAIFRIGELYGISHLIVNDSGQYENRVQVNHPNGSLGNYALSKIDDETFQIDEGIFVGSITKPLNFLNYYVVDFEQEELAEISGYVIDGVKYGNIDTNIYMTNVDQEKPTIFSISPNPSTNYINIHPNQALSNTQFEYQIYSIQGKLVQSNTIHIDASGTQIKLNPLNDGIYHLILKSNTDYFSKKIFIQND